jgi:SAM-dependent methyltransferase
MKAIHYLKYFFFIGTHWNFRFAAFSIYYEIKGEKKYQIDTSLIDYLNGEKINSNNLNHASIYQGSNYYLIEKAFEFLKDQNVNTSITDFGCGKGRVLVVAAHYGFTMITGVDFAPLLCGEAERNIDKVKTLFSSSSLKIVCEDAVNYKVQKDTNVFFFFNPFDEVVMLQVVKNILSSLKENDRKIYVVYINPLHKDIFLSAGFEEEYYLMKMKYLELSILSKEMED